ncbi:MAG: carboxypeptidase-like regulatory domain-containing protein, partial [Candidatus Dormiibacterota bacterium]
MPNERSIAVQVRRQSATLPNAHGRAERDTLPVRSAPMYCFLSGSVYGRLKKGDKRPCLRPEVLSYLPKILKEGIMRSLPTTLLVFALIAAGAWSQSVATSQISGTVRDSTGLVLPEAQVQVTQTDTGLVRSATTNSEGVYVLPSLPIGPYKMEVKKEGFSTFIQSGIVLQVDSNPTLDVSLKVGSVSEQIQVEASATMVETHTSGVGQVVD